jgi:hypothetical protein
MHYYRDFIRVSRIEVPFSLAMQENDMHRLLALALVLYACASHAQTCETLVAPASTSLSFVGKSYWRYTVSSGLLSGGPSIDELDVEFYSNAVNTFDLANSANSNYATCNQCVSFSRDYTVPVESKFFFQSAGVLSISQAPGVDPLAITLSNTRLVEVTLDPNTFESTPVPGGECYDLVPDQVFKSGFEN